MSTAAAFFFFDPGTSTQNLGNIDETTYMFSPKVLDRANTLEFRVLTEDLNGQAGELADVVPGDPKLVARFLHDAGTVDGDDEPIGQRQVSGVGIVVIIGAPTVAMRRRIQGCE